MNIQPEISGRVPIAIEVTERQSHILRVRELAKTCGAARLKTEGGGA